MTWIYVIAGVTWLFSFVIKNRMTAAFNTWGSTPGAAGLAGAETAAMVLRANDMRQVHLVPGRGQFSDHYDPQHKTIRLSEPVYAVKSVAAMAIAAHESGHAIQDAVHYRPFQIRSSLVPLAKLGAQFGLPAAIMGMFTDSPFFVQVGVLTYAGALVFQIATLPVEFDASKRALAQLDALDIMSADDRQGVKKVLKAAAMTYVAGVASSAGYLLFIAVIAGRAMFAKAPPIEGPR